MRIQLLALTLLLGHFGAQALEVTAKSANDAAVEPSSSSAGAAVEAALETAKDKRQVSSKETSLYPNHRSDAAAAAEQADDPEDGQETIYGPKPNQFIIRPIAPHQHQQHESHQEPQLRNYAAAAARPHAAQLLEQSQELQHYVYLQDIQRHQPKAAAGQGKAATAREQLREREVKKATPVAEEEQEQEAEQRYAVAIQPQPGLRGPYVPYQLPLPLAPPQHQHQQQQQQQHSQQQQQPQQPYQIIPEEQFLKLLEEELQSRAFHEQLRQQQQAQAQQQQAQQQQAQQQHHHQPQPRAQAQSKPIALPLHATAATHKVLQQAEPALGLGSYRDRYVAEQQLVQPSYSRGGPKYLPLSAQQQQQDEEDSAPAPVPQRHHHHPISALPPQIAYYQPQISYKTLPNHPLAKSSLESEIEKLLAANKPGPGQTLTYVDSSNEPSLVNHQHHQQQQLQVQQQHVTRLPPPPQHPAPPTSHPALRQPKAYLASTPNSLLDANNQPFVPSLFKFSGFQQPTPIYPGPQQQQQQEGKRLGPVVYPTGATAQPAQPSQYYYQETVTPTVSAKPKHYRTKHYKLPSPSPTGKSYEKALLYADYAERAQPAAPAPTVAHFYPSPPDPIKHQGGSPHRAVTPTALPIDYPAQPAPSQSSIYVSQGTGIATPSRITPTQPAVHKLRSLDEVKQLNLPPPNGKPLTQAEFQALVEAGYPVKAVPVPVPVPYDQYVKDHPEYRNHPPVDYAHLMRLATRQLAAHHPRSLVAPSEPSVKIISTPTAAEAQQQQTATGIGGGSVTYLQRRPRDEQDTAVAGSETKATPPAAAAESTKTQ